jgi:hypothetical protein
LNEVGGCQGDPIGRIFAGNCLLLATSPQLQKYSKFVGYFLAGAKVTYSFWPKYGLGYILGNFVPNSSGHPGG